MTNNLKDHPITTIAFAERAQEVFASFNPSRFSASIQESPNYLRPNDDLMDSLKTLLDRRVKSIRQSDVTHSIRVVESDALAKIVKRNVGSASAAEETINLDQLLSYINSRAIGRDYLANGNVLPNCRAEVEANRRLKQVLESGMPNGSDLTLSKEDTDPILGSDSSEITAAKLVQDYVELQMRKSTSPETLLRKPIPDSSAKTDQTENLHENVQTFALRIGASDVTAYHDFYNLQIAFEHVWEELFDTQIASLGKQLYEEYVKLKDFNGLDDGNDPTINTIEDLKRLMEDVKTLTQVTVQNMAPATNSATSGKNNTNNPSGSFDNTVVGAAGAAGAAGAVGAVAGAVAGLMGHDPAAFITGILLGKVTGLF